MLNKMYNNNNLNNNNNKNKLLDKKFKNKTMKIVNKLLVKTENHKLLRDKLLKLLNLMQNGQEKIYNID